MRYKADDFPIKTCSGEGTEHSVSVWRDGESSARVGVCLGNGHVATEFEPREVPRDTGSSAEMIVLARSFGLKVTAETGKDIGGFSYPIPRGKLSTCPCVYKSMQAGKDTGLMSRLGIEPDEKIEPHPKDSEVAKAFKTGVSLFLYGPTGSGKNRMVYSLLKGSRKTVTIMKNTEFGRIAEARARGESSFRFEGKLLVFNDLDHRERATKFYVEELWSLIDILADREAQAVIVSNLEPAKFVEKYTSQSELFDPETTYASMFRRITDDMQVIEVL